MEIMMVTKEKIIWMDWLWKFEKNDKKGNDILLIFALCVPAMELNNAQAAKLSSKKSR